MPVAFALAMVLAGQTPASVPSAQDLPVVAGTTASPDCGGMRESVGPNMRCVVTTTEKTTDLAFAYVAEARRLGWTDAGGAATALWMQRSAPGGGCERLTIASFWDFRAHPEPRNGLPAYVGLVIEPVRNCPAQPPVSSPQ